MVAADMTRPEMKRSQGNKQTDLAPGEARPYERDGAHPSHIMCAAIAARATTALARPHTLKPATTNPIVHTGTHPDSLPFAAASRASRSPTASSQSGSQTS
jgi:hypothetical protein